MGITKTWNPRKLIVDFGGLITGFADGTMLEASMNSDSFTMQSGGDGEVARAASPDRTGSVKFTLMQTSLSNDALSSAHAADQISNLGTKPLMIKDASGRTVISSPEAWVKKPPDTQFSKDLGTREWTIDCVELEMLLGGNN